MDARDRDAAARCPWEHADGYCDRERSQSCFRVSSCPNEPDSKCSREWVAPAKTSARGVVGTERIEHEESLASRPGPKRNLEAQTQSSPQPEIDQRRAEAKARELETRVGIQEDKRAFAWIAVAVSVVVVFFAMGYLATSGTSLTINAEPAGISGISAVTTLGAVAFAQRKRRP